MRWATLAARIKVVLLVITLLHLLSLGLMTIVCCENRDRDVEREARLKVCKMSPEPQLLLGGNS